MRKTLITLAALAAALPATAAFADSSISPDKRPLEQQTPTFNAQTSVKTYGYSGSDAASYVNPTPDKVPFGQEGARPAFTSHEVQTNYGGEAGSWVDPSPSKRPLGL